MKKPFETWDVDLMEGKASENALGRLLCHTRFEHKKDRQAAETGNVAIEYQNNKNGETAPSGISITTAEWWAIEFRPDCRLIVPTDYAKQLARIAIRGGRARWIGDGNHFNNALVPFGWFLTGGE